MQYKWEKISFQGDWAQLDQRRMSVGEERYLQFVTWMILNTREKKKVMDIVRDFYFS